MWSVAFEQICELTRILHDQILLHDEDTPLMNEIRDAMDVTWRKLTPQEEAAARKLSADLWEQKEK